MAGLAPFLFIGDFDFRAWLVPILQHVRIVLHVPNGFQFDGSAFKLDRMAHLATGILPNDIPPLASNPACGWAGPDVLDEFDRRLRVAVSPAPLAKLIGIHHHSSPLV